MKLGFSTSMLGWECINVTLVATEGKVMQINASNLLVVRRTADKASPYVRQEYTAYCNMCLENHKLVNFSKLENHKSYLAYLLLPA